VYYIKNQNSINTINVVIRPDATGQTLVQPGKNLRIV